MADSDDGPRPSKMRKGTHSCVECRRRKVRCILASRSDVVCMMCQRRGSRCTSQSTLETRYQHKLHLDVTSPPMSAVDQTHYSGHHSVPADHALLATPMSLVLAESHQQTPRAVIREPALIESADRRADQETRSIETITDKLLSALPSQRDVRKLWQAINSSETCHLFCYGDRLSRTSGSPDFPLDFGLFEPVFSPVLLATKMLLFAAALQSLPPTAHLGLRKDHVAVMDEVMEAVIRLVNGNDALVGSLEALDNLMLQAMFHMNCGNLKLSWITLRRAVTCAQIMGLHREGHHRFAVLNPATQLHPETMWHDIVYMERVGSLLLGLPTSTGMIVLQRANPAKAIVEDLSAVLGNVAASILDRNQIESPQQALDTTKTIDKGMISISEQMPPAFWRPLQFTGLNKDSPGALLEVQKAFNAARYHTLIIQLHTPYMLCPTYPAQTAYSRMACVNASREILSHEIALRSFAAISGFCRLSEFVALIAGVTLMLAHASSHCVHQAENLLSHQRLHDRALVERILDCLNTTDLQQDLPAVRCIALLKDLLDIEDDAARNHAKPAGDGDQGRSMMIVRMPFYGNVKISGRGIASVTLPNSEQEAGQSEGLDIGGIGSVRITRPTTQRGEQTSTHAGFGFSTEELDFSSAQYHHDFDPILNDWAFQGIDTAFFESLMREAGDTLAGASSGTST